MSKNELTPDLLRAITQVNDEYLRDNSILFRDDSVNNANIFKAAARFAAKRKKVRACIVPGCAAPTIVRSHTIQKTSLECIADNRHVYAPTAAHKSGRVEMRALGINKASVFPGFCSRHEGMFRQFEKNGRIATASDVTLQIYRSVCREIVRFRMDVEALREILGDYVEFRRGQLERLVKERVPAEAFSITRVRSSDLREVQATRYLADAELNLTSFTNHFEPAALAGLSDTELGLCTCAVIVDDTLPVCLSGRGNFHIESNGNIHNVKAMLFVLPQKRETIVSISVLQQDKDYLDSYLRKFAGSVGLLCMIESWMIHGTDHWFISPQTWRSIRTGIRRQILDDILDISKDIGCYYQHTIFNELKRQSVHEWQGSANRTVDMNRLIDQELKKFSD